MKIIVYSNDCPRCNVLERKLKEKNISFELFTDVDEMIKKGFTEVPMLEVGDEIMDFSNAIKWINSQAKE